MEGRTPSSRRARTLARIFASVLRREIGRNELHSRGFFPFLRITEITAWRMVRGKVLSESDSSKTDISKGASWSENFLKKSVGYPSSPGDLPLCIDLIADIISRAEKSFSNESAMFGSTDGTCRDLKKSSNTEGVVGHSDVYST